MDIFSMRHNFEHKLKLWNALASDFDAQSLHFASITLIRDSSFVPLASLITNNLQGHVMHIIAGSPSSWFTVTFSIGFYSGTAAVNGVIAEIRMNIVTFNMNK